MSDTVSVSFNCKVCGTKLTWPDDATDDTKISCSNCGEHFGTYADLRNKAVEATRDHVHGLFKDAFKNVSKGINIKFKL